MTVEANAASRLLEQLPALFQEDRVAGQPHFLGRLLLAFEHLLLGLGEPLQGLEEVVASVHRYFAPRPLPGAPANEQAPEEFLSWLAGWVALTLRQDWDPDRRRDLIAKAVQLYGLRGTKRGVEESLKVYTRLGVEIDELATPFQLGVHSSIGRDTLVGGGAPFYFVVKVQEPQLDVARRMEKQQVAKAILDLQKPAHTHYRLEFATPTFQIGYHSTVGSDTLIG